MSGPERPFQQNPSWEKLRNRMIRDTEAYIGERLSCRELLIRRRIWRLCCANAKQAKDLRRRVARGSAIPTELFSRPEELPLHTAEALQKLTMKTRGTLLFA